MNKSLLKFVALILSVTMILSIPINTANAASKAQNQNIAVSYEEETEPTPAVTETSEPSQSPESSPTTEPSAEPSPSAEPQPSDLPEPSPTEDPEVSPEPDVTTEPDIQEPSDLPEEYRPVTLESLVDEDGYLTNEGLLSLLCLPGDPEKYIEDVDNGDGTRSIKVYNKPIKFKDTDGEYKSIDNSITETKGAYDYRNKASDIQVGFSDDLNQDSAISIDYLNYKIGFRPLNILLNKNVSTAEISFEDSTEQEDEIFNNYKTYESINYSETFNNESDIQITPVSDGVKEEIILYEVPEKNEFSYELSVSDVVPVLRRDGNLYFIDLSKNAKVAAIAAPVMHDSKAEWEYSEDIAVELEKTGEDTYIYTIKPDESYLENAVYPVIIDPSITTLTDEGVGDTYVKSGSTSNYCNNADIIVGRNAAGNKYRGYIKILQTSLTYLRGQIPSGAKVIKVFYKTYEDYDGASSPTIELHPITPPDGEIWHLDTVTWADQPDYASSSYYSQTISDMEWYIWDVTDLGLDWINQTHENYGDYTYGFMLKIANESLNQYKTFNSQENSVKQNYFEFQYATKPGASVSTANWTKDNITVNWSGISQISKINPSNIKQLIPMTFKVQYATNSTTAEPTGQNFVTITGKDNQVLGSISLPITGLPLPEGQRYVFIRALYENGSTGPISAPCLYRRDVTYPSEPTTLRTEPIATSSYKNDSTPTIVWGGIADTLSGLSGGQSKAQVQVDNNSWELISNNVASGSYTLQTALTSGTHTIKVRGIDYAGNYNNTITKSVTYKLDATIPPLPSSVSLSPASWTNGGITITYSTVVDTPSGVDRYEYSYEGATSGFETIPEDNIIYPSDGYGYVWVRAVDKAGNLGTARQSSNRYYIDTQAPSEASSLNTTPDASSTWVNDATPILNWYNIIDSPSGIKEIEYRINSGEWHNLSNTSSGSYELSAFVNSGIYTIEVRGTDYADNIGEAVSVVYNFDKDNPDPVYDLSASVINGAANSGDSATIAITYDEAIDNPEEESSGIALYEIEKSIDNGVSYTAACTTSEVSYEIYNQPDSTSFIIRVRAKDNAGNYSDWVISDPVFTDDRTAPSAPSAVTAMPEGWTNDTTPVISWVGVQDGEGHLFSAQYKINDSEWIDIDREKGVDAGSIELDFSSRDDGEYTIYIRGMDALDNTGDTGQVIYRKDTTAPQNLAISSPGEAEIIDVLVDVVGIAADDRLSSWVLDYGMGDEPGTFSYLTSGTSSVDPADVLYVWNTESLTVGQTYTLRLRVNDTTGNINTFVRTIVKGSDPDPVIAASLQIDSPGYIVGEPNTNFGYQKANNGGNNGITGKLYVNGELKGTETQAGQGFNVDMTQYAEGKKQKFFIEAKDEYNNLFYSCKTQNDKLREYAFDDSDNISSIENLIINNGTVSLEQSGSVYESSGYFIIDPITVSNETFRLTVPSVKTLPSQTSLEYEYSTDSGTNWYSIPNEGVIINGASEVIIKVVFSTQDGEQTPVLDTMSVNALYFIGQQPLFTYLIDAPENLSTRANVNHTTLLRWDASSTQGASYNIYRSTSEQGEYSLIAQNITEPFWYDYNLCYGQTFYYKVKAAALINGATRESVATNTAFDTMVDENEIDKYIGSKPYWNFIDFGTGSGAGQINTVSGNLYYQTVDYSQYAPGMSIDITRTYNSQADYKTPLGKGWDLGYNIMLLKEYDNETGEETAMILKASDGTLYRYTKTENGYERPVATYMDLNYDSETGRYSVSVKGGTVFQFNDKLMIESITDINGNTISMGYDSRGNLVTVSDEVGDVINLSYSYNYSGLETDRLTSVTDINDAQTLSDDVEYHYDYNEQTGRLEDVYVWLDSQETDKYGETYGYNTGGLISSIANPAGKHTQISYTNDKVTAVTNPINEQMSISYGEGYTTSEFRNAVTRYDYDDTVINGLLLVTRVTNALGHYTDLEYDSNLNIESVTYLNKVGSTENVQVTSENHFDNNGDLLYAVRPDGRTTYYQDETHPYNEFGNNTILKTPFKLDGQNVVYAETIYEYYPGTGNLKKVTDPVGHTTEYTYDGFGNVLNETSTVNGLSTTTSYQYDSKGRLVKTIYSDNTETEQGYDIFDNVIWTEDAENVRTNYEFDILGRNTRTIYPGEDGSITTDDIFETNRYDKNDNVIRNQNANTVTLYTYDDIGRALTTVSAYGTPDQSTDSVSYGAPDQYGSFTVTSTDGDGVQSTTTYDALGRAIRSQSGDTWTETVYDNAGQAIQTTDNTGEICKTEYDILGQTATSIEDWGDSTHKNYTSTYGYDLAGNCTMQTDASGYITETEYDIAGRTTHVQKTDTSTDPDTVISEEYTYDSVYDGKVRSTTTDSLGHETVYAYNPTGTLASETNKGDPDAGGEMAISYTYDDNDWMLTQTRPDSSVITYTYDDMGRLTKTQYSEDYYVEYTYDENGNQLTMTKTKGEETEINSWEYDAQDRVKTVLLNGSIVVKYKYTTAGYLSETWYPEGEGWRITRYTYNDDGLLTGVYDATDSQDIKLIREYIYTEGELTSLKDYRKFDEANDDGDYSLQEFEYGTDKSLKGVTYSDVDKENGEIVSTTQREKYALTFNDDGSIQTEDIDLDYGVHADVLKEYTYAAFGWLKTESVNSDLTTYDYDYVGNRKSMTTASGTVYYKYNEFNQLTQTASDENFQNIIMSFGYDGRGNQTSQTDSATNTAKIYDYDLADLLLSVKAQTGQNPQTTLAEYLYDGSGQRIQKTEGENTTRFYYDGLDLLYTGDGTSQRLEENIIEPDGSVIASKRFAGSYANKHYFYRQDIRGSVTNIIDKDGAVLLGYTYDAYGNTTEVGDTNFINSKAYTGAVNDEITGLYYMNARYYNPATGRFLTEDSVREGNLYTYCGGDPVNYIDPTGHATQPLTKRRTVAFDRIIHKLYANVYDRYFTDAGKKRKFNGLKWRINPADAMYEICWGLQPVGSNLMVNYAKYFVGVLPYNNDIDGNLAEGADCNDFCREIYRSFGYSIHSMGTVDLADQAKRWEYNTKKGFKPLTVIFGPGFGVRHENTNCRLNKSKKIKDIDDFISKLKIGDLIVFDLGTKRAGEYGGADHVGMYIGAGKIIHEHGHRNGCRIQTLKDLSKEQKVRMPIYALRYLTKAQMDVFIVPMV